MSCDRLDVRLELPTVEADLYDYVTRNPQWEDSDGIPTKLRQQLTHYLVSQDIVSLQVFAGSKGLSTEASVRFFGHPQNVTYSDNILGRIFRGSGEPYDDGPDLSSDPKIEVAGPTVNPMMRVMPTKMIQTEVPMIDLFNCLVESQVSYH